MGELRQLAQAHETFDAIELAAAIHLFDLPIQQVAGNLPTSLAGGGGSDLLTKVCGDSVEVEVEAITGKDRGAARCQDL